MHNSVKIIGSLLVYGLFLFGASCNSSRLGGSSSTDSKTTDLTDKEEVEFKKLFFNANREKILGNNEAAAELFAKCIRKDPKNSASMFELSRLYLEAGKISEALFFAEKTVEISSDNIWYHYSLAEMYLISNNIFYIICIFHTFYLR